MILIQATQAEYDEIFDILCENARWLESKGIFQWPLDWLHSNQDEIRTSVNSGLYFKVEIDNHIAGVVEITGSPDDVWAGEESPALYIHKLAIRRQYSNQCLGRGILDLIAKLASDQGLEYLRLDCVAHNTNLRQYYESYGFEFINEKSAGLVNLALYQCAVKG
ncbi:MAG: GNAT family N-acetyltransferase [Pseudomonadales bacterium]|nr:GNAT family N-acetyltransferase [Pseudomonadales bacterium]